MQYIIKVLSSRNVQTNIINLVASIALMFGIVLPGAEVGPIAWIVGAITIVAPFVASYFRIKPKSTFKE